MTVGTWIDLKGNFINLAHVVSVNKHGALGMQIMIPPNAVLGVSFNNVAERDTAIERIQMLISPTLVAVSDEPQRKSIVV